MRRAVIKVNVDVERCQGHGLCEAAAPGLFAFDESGYNVSESLVVGDEHRSQVDAAIATCPERAIAQA